MTVVSVALWRFLSRIYGRWWFGPAPEWERVRARVVAGTRYARAPREVRVDNGRVGSVPAEILTPRAAPADAAVLYLHGSGFVIGAPQMVRPLSGGIAAAMRTTVYALDYRLAPEHPYPAAVEDTVEAYQALLDRGIPAERIAVVGDSAGGTLALDLAQRLRDRHLPAPAILGLLCPVLDFSTDSEAFHCDPSREPLLTPELMARFMDAYLPGVPDPERRALSPVNRDLTGLPPMVLHSAGDDLLAGDARRFAARAAKSGVPLRHREYRNLWHVFHAMPMRPAREAVHDFSRMLAEAVYGHHTGYRSGQ
ncbi:alpha/beta hydrolase [Nocardia huaxiensis]|uniref:alpha/beta hydrolase n=1 Tax=Nocardia huaxiensis TaxID=2755382 RepID=UPI001E28D3B9|nr:alpha/beta hydrolase [Nocardia huaxiensis]UFS93622.1 alpha/beta hydrolase [Nocardia huaxiensis]